MSFHPLIKIVSYIVAAGFIVRTDEWVLAGVFAVLLGATLFPAGRPGKKMLQTIWRLKWLWLSLLILYGWLTPAAGVSSASGGLMPSGAGLLQGGERIASLILLLWIAHLIWRTTARETLIAGLYQFLYPLSWFRLDRDQLTMRLYLTFAQIETLRDELANLPVQGRPDQRLVSACEHVMQGSAPTLRYVKMQILPAPALWMWLIPLLTGLVLGFIERSF